MIETHPSIIHWQTDFHAEPENYCVYLGVDTGPESRVCVYEVGVFHSLKQALTFADRAFGLTAALAIKQLPDGITADDYDGEPMDARNLIAGITIERFTDAEGTIKTWDKDALGDWSPLPWLAVAR